MTPEQYVQAINAEAQSARDATGIMTQAYNCSLDHIINAGMLLNKAKADGLHGEWGRWLRDNFTFTHGTANHWMRLASHPEEVDELRAGGVLTVRGLLKALATPKLGVPKSQRVVNLEQQPPPTPQKPTLPNPTPQAEGNSGYSGEGRRPSDYPCCPECGNWLHFYPHDNEDGLEIGWWCTALVCESRFKWAYDFDGETVTLKHTAPSGDDEPPLSSEAPDDATTPIHPSPVTAPSGSYNGGETSEATASDQSPEGEQSRGSSTDDATHPDAHNSSGGVSPELDTGAGTSSLSPDAVHVAGAFSAHARDDGTEASGDTFSGTPPDARATGGRSTDRPSPPVGGTTSAKGKSHRRSKPKNTRLLGDAEENPYQKVLDEIAFLKRFFDVLYKRDTSYVVDKEEYSTRKLKKRIDTFLEKLIPIFEAKGEVRWDPPPVEAVITLAARLGISEDDARIYYDARASVDWTFITNQTERPVRSIPHDLPAYTRRRKHGEANNGKPKHQFGEATDEDRARLQSILHS